MNSSDYYSFDMNYAKIAECLMEIQSLSSSLINVYHCTSVPNKEKSTEGDLKNKQANSVNATHLNQISDSNCTKQNLSENQRNSTDWENLLNDNNKQICEYLSTITELNKQQSQLYKIQSQNLDNFRERGIELENEYDSLMLDYSKVCDDALNKEKTLRKTLDDTKEKNKKMEAALKDSNSEQESLKKRLENEKKKNVRLQAKLKDLCDKQKILEKNLNEQTKKNSNQKLLSDKLLSEQGLFLARYHQNNICKLTEEREIMSNKIQELIKENCALKKRLERFENKKISDKLKINLCKQNFSFKIESAINKYQQTKNSNPANIKSVGLNK